MKTRTKRGIRQLLSLLAVVTVLTQLPVGAVSVLDKNDTLNESKVISAEENATLLRADELPENIRNLLPKDKEEHSVYLEAMEKVGGDYDASELYTLRTENPLTGEGTLTVHSSPIKYIDDNGDLQFIDTAVKPITATRESGTSYAYKNAANSFTVEYATTATNGINFNDTFSFSVKEDATTRNVKTITKTDTSKVVYADAFGTDTAVEYINIENGIKENIILNKYTGQNRFDFVFRSETHIPILAKNGMYIWIANKKTPKEPEYRFLSLYAYDSYDPAVHSVNKDTDFRHMNEELYYELTSNADGTYTITIVVPEEYLTHPEVVYPVTIDPSVTKVSSNSNTHDNFVSEATPSTVSNRDLDYLRFGNVNGYMNFAYHRLTSLPSISGVSHITSAKLKFTFRSGQTTPASSSGIKMGVLQVESKNWSEATITWNNQPFGTSGPLTSITYNGSYLDYFEANITDMVRNWYSGKSKNYGVDFTYNNTSYNDYNSVVSCEGDSDRAPVLTIAYQTTGLTSGKFYYLRNENSERYLDVPSHKSADGTYLIQHASTKHSNQLFKIQYNADTLDYSIYPACAPGSALTIANGSSANNERVEVWAKPDTGVLASQRFRIKKNSDGTHSILSYSSNYTKALQVLDASTSNSGKIVQYTNDGSTNQKWYFHSASSLFTSLGDTYSLFSLGNDNMSAYNHVIDYIDGNTINSKKYTSLTKFNYTKGKIDKKALLEYLKYSDVAFLDSHAYATHIEMRDQNGSIYSNLNLANDIGKGFKEGSTTKTNTPFNKKTKWLIIQACSQLNYTAGGSDNSALLWAQALLGDGVRMHGVLSYYGSGPAGDIAGKRIEAFLENQTKSSNQLDMISAWQAANEPMLATDSSWAAICHRQNKSDKLYGGWTADTTNGSAYTIDRYSLDNSPQTPLPITVTQIDTELSSNVGFALESENVADQSFVLADKTFTTAQQQKIQTVLDADKTTLPSAGKLTYINSTASLTETTTGILWTENQVINKAKDYLNELGLLPQDDYMIRTTTAVREEFDLVNATAGPKEIVSWTIRFYQTINDVPIVSDDEAGIVMRITQNGLFSLQYNWKTVLSAEKLTVPETARNKTLSKQDMMELYCALVSSDKTSLDTNVHYRQAYLYLNGTATPVWVFGAGDAFVNSVFFNAITGERITVN